MGCCSGCCATNNNKNITKIENRNNDIVKKLIIKIVLGSLFFGMAYFVFKENFYIQLASYLISYGIIGGEVLKTAFNNIKKGKFFDENFLMSVATLGAITIGEYPEGIAVMLFYQVGELFQEIAVNNSKKSIVNLMNLNPESANLKVGTEIKKINPEMVRVGNILVVKPGEKIPLDGIITKGSTSFDTSTLTGESLPREMTVGDEVLSGYINKSSMIEMEVTKSLKESTISKILDLVENATNKKSKTENFIRTFAKYYTPIVTFIAIFIAIVPPILLENATFSQWIYRAMVFLVISCPCALVLSIPLGFFGGIGSASRHGILVKGSNFIEGLNYVDTVVMDKTGTLTKGVFKVTDIESIDISKEELLKYAAHGEIFSTHPIAQSIVKEYEKNGVLVDKTLISEYEEKSGYGVKVVLDNKIVLVGNSKLMENEGIDILDVDKIGTKVFISVDKKYCGYILIADEIKENSKKTVEELRNKNINNIVMLTGDNNKIAKNIGDSLGINKVYSELLPQDKVEKLEEIYKNKENKKGKVIFVGDGINDAPILARADIGVAMGGIGSDAAIEAADIVIMNDDPLKIVTSLKIAKRTREIVWQNIGFSIIIKVLVLILGAGGLATMWEAIFADVGVALIAIFNAMRIIKTKFE